MRVMDENESQQKQETLGHDVPPQAPEEPSAVTYFFSNNEKMLVGLGAVLAMLILSTGVYFLLQPKVQPAGDVLLPTLEDIESLFQDDGIEPGGCTGDVKQCPDGKYVGRTGPNCEFTECSAVEEVRDTTKTYGNIETETAQQFAEIIFTLSNRYEFEKIYDLLSEERKSTINKDAFVSGYDFVIEDKYDRKLSWEFQRMIVYENKTYLEYLIWVTKYLEDETIDMQGPEKEWLTLTNDSSKWYFVSDRGKPPKQAFTDE